ncbi:NAD(P)H-binding protein [Bacillus sp. REN3]|uniref:NAD(P)H-binding protein n=1 Tax=Bacillus sp. REN3 TaxID=2802440 RepID=UPI001AEE7063|nr:NAD(P)H-binding protein [Bacillus sp. REN3]
MKVVVFGAHSSVGGFLVEKLQAKGHHSCAVVGKENQQVALRDRGASETAVYGQSSLDSIFKGYEAVIFLTGINPKAQTGKTVLVDHESVMETVKEAERQGVRRFVLMSAIKADEAVGDESREIGAKEMPDEFLRHERLNYTVVQPGALNDQPGDGKITAAETIGAKGLEISREDLAEVLAEVLNTENTFNKTFEVASGDRPIQEALASL